MSKKKAPKTQRAQRNQRNLDRRRIRQARRKPSRLRKNR